MSRGVAVYVCGPGLETRWAEDMCARQEREHEEAIDRAIEAELGPWPSMDGPREEVDVEAVPVHVVPWWCGGER